MVITVASYHKGYSITGSTKIIHRYVPKEVGELLIYYLWLILQFCSKLDLLLARNRYCQPSTFLWGKPNGVDPWDSSRLSRVLKREFQAAFGQTMKISTYRHLVIVISRKHHGSGGFKRDYGLEDTRVDQQSSHTSWTAGSIYARGLEEAAGHVEERKSLGVASSSRTRGRLSAALSTLGRIEVECCMFRAPLDDCLGNASHPLPLPLDGPFIFAGSGPTVPGFSAALHDES